MQDTSFQVQLPWPDIRLSPNSRVNRYSKAEATREAKATAFAETRNEMLETGNPQFNATDALTATVLFFPPKIKRRRDGDNMQASIKPYLDGVTKALDIDDERIVSTCYTRMEPVGEPAVFITLERID